MRPPLPPSRFRRVAKRIGLVVCFAILAMWAASSVSRVAGRSPHWVVQWEAGQIHVWRLSSPFDPETCGVSSERSPFDAGLVLPGWPIIARRHLYLCIPFWTLLALAGVPTAILWHRDRRKPKPGG